MKIGIIGFGNLGRALASGLIKSGRAGAGNTLYVCDKSPEVCALAEKEPYNALASVDVNYVTSNAELIFLTIKGYAFEELSADMDRNNLEGKTVVSCMAGETFEKIYSLIGKVNLVRAMPSLAIAACDGVVGYTKSPDVVAEIFHELGYALEVEPDVIEKVMAFSGCGLGFAAYLIDAFCAAGRAMGFSPEISAQIAAKSFKNAADRGYNFRETVSAVATKGGATEQGIMHMDSNGVYDIVAAAVRKAYEKMA